MSQCPVCSWYYEDGGYHDCTDEAIGSLLEHWLTRDTGQRCRFDNVPLAEGSLTDKLRDASLRFCGAECRKAFETISEARVVLGLRDLNRRGFD